MFWLAESWRTSKNDIFFSEKGKKFNPTSHFHPWGQGDITQKSFDQICDLCRNLSRNQSRSGRGVRSINNKPRSTGDMIIGLENKMEI